MSIGGTGALSFGTGAISDFFAAYNGYQTATLMEEQGDLTRQDYERQASIVRQDGARFRAKQAMQYINGGVEIVGTPQLVMKETFIKYREKAKYLEWTGREKENLMDKQADMKKDEALGNIISGVISTAAMAAVLL